MLNSIVEPTNRPPNTAHGGPIAEIGYDDASRVDQRSGGSMVASNVLVAKPRKSISAHALVIVLPGRGEDVFDPRMISVKRDVEAGDLRYVRKCLMSRLDTRGFLWPMDWDERDEAAKSGDGLVIEQNGRLEREPL